MTAPPADDPLLGSTLDGRYLVQGVLGRGGMATVFGALDVKLGRPVAVKALHAERRDSSDALARLHREGRIAAGLAHPNVCAVTDIGSLPDGTPYLVLERLVGETLAARIAERGPLAVDEITELVAQVLSALSVVHELGIVHRDLKPANVFLADVRGRAPIAKVLDFGSASLPRDDPSTARTFGLPDVSLTATGMVIGTPVYMAPEQAGGATDLDQRVDVFAAGVLLYEGLTGRRPFNARSFVALMHKISSAEAPTVRSFRRDVPERIERCVERAMARRREDRYERATQFLEDLTPYAASEARSRPPTPAIQSWDFPTGASPTRGRHQK